MRRPERNLVHRVLDVLHVFTPERPELTLTNISRHAGLPLATAHRLIGELVRWGALERGSDGRYRLTVKVGQLGAATPGVGRLSRAAMPALSELFQLTGHQAHLAVLDHGDAVVVASIDSRGPDPVQPRRQPAPTTAAGLALLAHAPRQTQEQAVLAQAPDGTGPSPATLRQILAEARRLGVAVCAGPPLLRPAAAAVVRDASGEVVAAVAAVAGTDGEPRRLTSAVLAAAGEISAALGHHSGTPARPAFVA